MYHKSSLGILRNGLMGANCEQAVNGYLVQHSYSQSRELGLPVQAPRGAHVSIFKIGMRKVATGL